MEPARFSAMAATLPVRREIHEFIQAAEFLLSPALQIPELTYEEGIPSRLTEDCPYAGIVEGR